MKSKRYKGNKQTPTNTLSRIDDIDVDSEVNTNMKPDIVHTDPLTTEEKTLLDSISHSVISVCSNDTDIHIDDHTDICNVESDNLQEEFVMVSSSEASTAIACSEPIRSIVPYVVRNAEARLLKYVLKRLRALTPRLLAHAIIYYYGGSGGSLMLYLVSRALQLGLL